MQGFHGNRSCLGWEPLGRGSGNRPHVGEGEGQVGAGRRCGPPLLLSLGFLSAAGQTARHCRGTALRQAALLGCCPGDLRQVRARSSRHREGALSAWSTVPRRAGCLLARPQVLCPPIVSHPASSCQVNLSWHPARCLPWAPILTV